MTTNASELMRLMVVREPEVLADAPVIELVPSDKLQSLVTRQNYAAARKALAKFGSAPANVFQRVEDVPQSAQLLEFRRLAEADPAADAATLVKSAFGTTAAKVTEAADWAPTRRKISDSILVLKLAYGGGPRPLAELAALLQAKAAIDSIAGGDPAAPKTLAFLRAPMMLPAPFSRSSAAPLPDRTEEKQKTAIERASAKLKILVDQQERLTKIEAGLADLRSVPVNSDHFTVREGTSGVNLPKLVTRRKPDSPFDEQIAASVGSAFTARWAAPVEGSRISEASRSAMDGGLRLTEQGLKKLAPDTRKLLSSLNLDPAAHPVEQLASALEDEKATLETSAAAFQPAERRMGFVAGIGVVASSPVKRPSGDPPFKPLGGIKIPPGLNIDWDNLLTEAGWPGQPPTEPEPEEADLGPSMLLPAGVGQLFVIKQQILGYRSGEVSHIENVLRGETRERNHRRLQQREETTVDETSVEREDEKSLQTTTRAELEREVQSTIKRQFDYGASAQVSGDYGKIEFTAAGQVQGSTSSETATKTAQKVASEVVETARQRVTERVRSERTLRILEEVEETNIHKFSGEELTEPMVGVYQWLDKVFTNEVWSYGNRTMYEVVVPEPAAGVIAGATAPAAQTPHLVERPYPLSVSVRLLDPATVAALCAQYGVTEDIEAFPEPALVSVSFTHSSDASAQDNFYAETKEIDIAPGHQLVDGWLTVRARGENQKPMIGVTLASASQRVFTQNIKNDEVPDGPLPITFATDQLGSTVKKLQAAIAVDDYSSFAVNVTIRTRPSPATIDKWRRTAFAAIRSAYDAKLAEWREYQSQIDFENPSVADKLFGRNPSSTRSLIKHELQRLAIEVFRNQSLNLDLVNDGAVPDVVPRTDFQSLSETAPEILFLSQAFEWENMTFVLYPYFFGRRRDWALKLSFSSGDETMAEFLKSGAARVQVPVRPGFEAAVDHYMMTREPFFGRGMPHIGDDLYLPYVDEARAAFGVALDGTHHSDMDFQVTVPTSLVIARQGRKIDTEGGTLPKWVKSGDLWVEAPA